MQRTVEEKRRRVVEAASKLTQFKPKDKARPPTFSPSSILKFRSCEELTPTSNYHEHFFPTVKSGRVLVTRQPSLPPSLPPPPPSLRRHHSTHGVSNSDQECVECKRYQKQRSLHFQFPHPSSHDNVPPAIPPPPSASSLHLTHLHQQKHLTTSRQVPQVRDHFIDFTNNDLIIPQEVRLDMMSSGKTCTSLAHSSSVGDLNDPSSPGGISNGEERTTAILRKKSSIRSPPAYSNSNVQSSRPRVQIQIPVPKNLNELFGVSPSDIDKYSRVVFPVCFVCFNLMYWMIYLHISKILDSEAFKKDDASAS